MKKRMMADWRMFSPTTFLMRLRLPIIPYRPITSSAAVAQ